MSRTVKGAKSSGFEWWSKRTSGKGQWSGTSSGSKFGKRLTHKAERQQSKREAI